MPFPYIFTFYSYKGGVGRSLALLNVGYALAGRGRHVLMVDMDLEAPGISGFLERSKELAVPVAAHPKDVLTLLGDAIDALGTGSAGAEIVEKLPPVSNYMRSIDGGKLAALRPRIGKLGRLDVLGIDVPRDYFGRYGSLGLKDLPQARLIELSRLLHHYFKAQTFRHRPLGLEEFEPAIPTRYDYVLVDSRTGITEIGGLCVGPLADRLVVVTGLNDQNVNGTLDFMKEAGIEPKPRPADAENWDEDDVVGAGAAENPSLGPKPTIVVASPVPAGEIEYKRSRLDELERVLGIRPFPLSYHPQMALMESVFVRDYREEYLAAEYKNLATRVMAHVGDDPPTLASKSSRLWEQKQTAGAIACVLRLTPHEPGLGVPLLQQLGEPSTPLDDEGFWALRQLNAHLSQGPRSRPLALNNWGAVLFLQSKTKAGQEPNLLLEEASRKYAEAIHLDPANHSPWINWGNALWTLAKTKSGQDADRLFEEAGRKYSEAIRLKPAFPDAWKNWGNAFAQKAKTTSGQEADRLFEEAGRKYSEAVRLKRDDHEAFYNWGIAIFDQAETKSGEEANRLLEEASQKYAEAIRLKPDFPEAWNNWGNALWKMAKSKSGSERDRLFEEVSRTFAEAVRLKPEVPEAWSNWAGALLDQGRTKSGEEARELFEQAGRKCAEAVRLRPTIPRAWNNWGVALLEEAKAKSGEEADWLFEEAGEKYAEAIRLEPDFEEALVNWSAALISQVETKSGGERSRLLQQAREKLLVGEGQPAGARAFNLACVEALEENAPEAVRWLKMSGSSGTRISKARVAEEKNFDGVRSDPEFVSYVESLPDE